MSILRSDVLIFNLSPDISLCQQLFLKLRKVDVVTYSNFKTNFVFGSVSLDCRLRLLKYFFLSHFRNRNGFFFFLVLLVPVQCLDKTFWTLSLAQSRKILSEFPNLSAILNDRGKTNGDVTRASVL